MKGNADWFDGYMNYVDLAEQYEITGNGKNLIPLAETCYVFLKKIVQEKMRE